MTETPLIFISYATADRERVVPFHDHLCNSGFDVWMDFRRLKGGQNWGFEIRRALNRAALIVMFVSINSVDRRGYVQREIKLALDKAQEKLIDDVYIIPIKLDTEAPVPDQLAGIHVIFGEGTQAFKEAEDAIREQLDRLGTSMHASASNAGIRWSEVVYRDEWEGLPGYRSEFNLPRFSSDLYPKISEVSDILKGALTSFVQRERHAKLFSGESHLNFGMDRFFRTNTWEAVCGAPAIKGRCLSVQYNVTWWGAGAAHPNSHFLTFNFLLDPIIQIDSPELLFEKPDEALELVRAEVRSLLLVQESSMDATEPMRLDPDYVSSGTETWSNLGHYVFGEGGVTFLFGNYEVAQYVFGLQSATVPYEKLVGLMRREFACALDIEHLNYQRPTWDETTVQIVAETDAAIQTIKPS